MSGAGTPFQTLRLDNVGRDFGAINALRDLSFTVQRGEFIALLGPSGCGKSTALNCIAGLLATTRGAIWLDDRRVDTLDPEARGFGMVFQNYALFPHMSVRANVGFGLKMRGLAKPDIARRVDAAIATVRLQAQADKLPGQLSGGQQQRVAIARAIAIEPPLVLMDEPLSNLDAKLRLEMRAEIRRIHQSLGAITLYVTHDQDEALSLADRIVVLRDGVMRQIGTPQELYAKPATLDVADFMGFRTQIKGNVARDASVGVSVELQHGGNALFGFAQQPLKAGPCIAAIRPDDLVPVSSGGAGFDARVESIEYRGRDWFGVARLTDGSEAFFRAPQSCATGTMLRLGADPQRVLIFGAV